MIEIRPLGRCDAVLTIPGSKSYTHRALVISALAEGESVLTNALQSEDTEHTIRALERFGIPIFKEGNLLRVLGKGERMGGSEEEIFLGNSGTSMRFLTAVAALKRNRTCLDGNERMCTRPMGPLLQGLNELGVRAYSRKGDGCPPVIVESQGLEGGVVRVKGEESSQFLSALLLVAPYARRDVRILVDGSLASQPYVDMTLSVMSDFGVEVQAEGHRSFLIRSGQRYSPRVYPIEGDASNASYFFSAAAVTRGRVRVENFPSSSKQGDAGFLDILERMGCEVVRGEGWIEVKGRDLRGIEIDMNAIPDLVPTLAVTAAFASGRTVIRRIGHLRVKESDRIRALAVELAKIGIRVEEGKDWLSLDGGIPHGAAVETYEDHRLAMSFAVAGLAVPGIRIKNEACVNKSFPDFWGKMEGFYS